MVSVRWPGLGYVDLDHTAIPDAIYATHYVPNTGPTDSVKSIVFPPGFRPIVGDEIHVQRLIRLAEDHPQDVAAGVDREDYRLLAMSLEGELCRASLWARSRGFPKHARPGNDTRATEASDRPEAAADRIRRHRDNDCDVEAATTSSRSQPEAAPSGHRGIHAQKMQQALKIIEDEGPVKAVRLAKALGIEPSTFLSHYAPSLKTDMGVRNDGEGLRARSDPRRSGGIPPSRIERGFSRRGIGARDGP